MRYGLVLGEIGVRNWAIQRAERGQVEDALWGGAYDLLLWETHAISRSG